MGRKAAPQARRTRSEAAQFRERQATVLGMVERGGQVRLRVIASRRGPALSRAVRANVNPTSIIFTDDWRAYKPLGREYLDHRVINHSAGLYVDGDIHTNTIEGFFGNFKTGMRGAYKKISAEVAPVLPGRVRLALQPALPGHAVDVPLAAGQGGAMSERRAIQGASASAAKRRERADAARERRPTTYGATAKKRRRRESRSLRLLLEAGLSRQGVYDLLAERPSP